MNQEHAGRSTPLISLRIPQNLREKVKSLALKNRRSLNSEILSLIENHIEQNENNQNATH